MLGTIVNVIAIIVGSIIGLFFKGGIPEKINDTVMKCLALCVIYIGISGSLKCENPIVMIVCMALGGLIGEAIDIDKRLNNLGVSIEKKLLSRTKGKKSSSNDEKVIKKGKASIAEGFVYSSLIFCVGAMAIVGSLESGLNHNYETLFTKSILDFISAIVFASGLGIGVILAAGAVLIYQGTITIFASLIAGLLSTSVITAISSIGSLLIMGLGFNVLGISNIKVANMIPAIFLPIIAGVFGII